MDRSTIGAIVGENVRRLREQRGWTQQELASRLRGHGLGWTRHQVAAIEIGRREGIEVAELLILVHLFQVPPAELIGSPYPGVTPEVHLTPEAAMRTDHICQLLAGDPKGVGLALSEAAGATAIALMAGGLRADQQLADRLGVDVSTVIEAAEQLWRHSLTEERDRRAADLAGDQRARRGHITRQLSIEIEQQIAKREE